MLATWVLKICNVFALSSVQEQFVVPSNTEHNDKIISPPPCKKVFSGAILMDYIFLSFHSLFFL
jgi:hypothetical protein